MSDNQKPCEPMRYFALALDPIHVGTGGFRLGRVDMSIVREPGTNLPKIPGTSLSGACRTYAAMQTPGKWPDCAGQGQVGKGHCGCPDCPICITFGFSKGESGSFQGLAQFSDAQLVLFPVHSLAGPVWVTCPSVSRGFEIAGTEAVEDDTVHVAGGIKEIKRLNLGWLMLDVADGSFDLDADKLRDVPPEILNRAVLVSDKLFSHVVNDNLEVRTSVSIDPATGAAAEGALFTYEALPRASVLTFDVVMSGPGYYLVNGKLPLDGDIGKVKETVRKGNALFEYLGVGGMSTRGMGRLRISEVKND